MIINKKIFTIVLTGHLILIFFIIMIWENSVHVSDNKVYSLQAFLVKQDTIYQNKNKMNSFSNTKNELTLKKNHIQKHKKNNSRAQLITTNQSTQNHSILLALIHHTISQYQTYPESALMMQQKGTVTVSFILTPEGQLKNPHIIHSSGYKILDESAIQAINAIPIIPEASKYLRQPENFQVDVMFV